MIAQEFAQSLVLCVLTSGDTEVDVLYGDNMSEQVHQPLGVDEVEVGEYRVLLVEESAWEGSDRERGEGRSVTLQ